MFLRRLPPLLVVAAIPAVGAQHGNPLGSSDCPCLTLEDPAFETIRATLADGNFNQTYGLHGCGAYDEPGEVCAPDCKVANNKPAYCAKKWCYVDPETCAQNEERCRAAGGIPGSDNHTAACRNRRFAATACLGTNVAAYYSYQTCDYDDSFTPGGTLSNRMFKAVVLEELGMPWVKKGQPSADMLPAGRTIEGPYFGVMVEFWLDVVLNGFVGTKTMTRATDAISSVAKERSPLSTWTAAVYDVGNGRFDIAIGNIWITSQRLRYTTFLPAIGNDLLYLFVKDEDEPETLGTKLRKPFLPFADSTWLFIIGVLTFVGFVVTLIEFLEGKFQAENPNPKEMASRTGGNVYRSFVGFVGGGSHDDRSAATKSLVFGFYFFLMLTLSAYTANLASILTAQKAFSGVSSVDDVLRLQMKVCVYEPAVAFVLGYDPRLKDLIVPVAYDAEPRKVYAGECDCFIHIEEKIPALVGGAFNAQDCAEVEKGTLTAEEAHCKRDTDGKPATDRDCGFRQVGETVAVIQYSWPINPNLPQKVKHALAWSVLDRSTGFKQRHEQYKFLNPQNKCGSIRGSGGESPGLPIESLIGATLLGGVFIGIGVLIAVGDFSVRMKKPKANTAQSANGGKNGGNNAISKGDTKGGTETSTMTDSEMLQKMAKMLEGHLKGEWDMNASANPMHIAADRAENTEATLSILWGAAHMPQAASMHACIPMQSTGL